MASTETDIPNTLDAYEKVNGSGWVHTTSNTAGELRVRSNSSDSTRHVSCLTFDLAAEGTLDNSTITNCTLTLTTDGAWEAGTGLDAVVYAEKEDSVTDLSSGSAGTITGMNKTTASVAWDSGGSTTAHTEYETDNLSAIFNEVIAAADTDWDGKINVIVEGVSSSNEYVSFASESNTGGSGSYAPTLTWTHDAGPQDRILDDTITGAATVSGQLVGPTKTVFILDGTGAPTSGSLSSPTGVDTSGEVDAYSIDNDAPTWGEETTNSFSDHDRKITWSQYDRGAVEVSTTGHMDGPWAARWYSDKSNGGAVNNNILVGYNDQSGVIFSIQRDTDGETNILVQGSGGSNATGTTDNDGDLVRYELKCSGTSSSDTLTLQIYNDSDTLVETVGPATIGTVTDGQEVDKIRFGNVSGTNNDFLSYQAIQNFVIQSGGAGDYVGAWSDSETFTINGSALGVASVEAELFANQTHVLDGSALGVADVDGTNALVISGNHLINGEGFGSATTSAAIAVTRHLDGTVLGVANVSGTILSGVTHVPASYEWHDTDQTVTYPRRGVLASPSYGDANSRNLEIYYPDSVTHGDGPYPTFVWIHGGNWYKNVTRTDILETPSGGDSDNGAAFAMLEALRDDGWAVVSLDYRQVQGSGTPAGPNEDILQWPDQLDDVRLAVSWLKNSGDPKTDSLDMTRWALGGHSAGAYLALTAGFLPTRTNADGGSGDNYYQHWSPAGDTTYDYLTSTRYASGGDWDVDDDIVPMALAVWDPPIDMKRATQQEDNGFANLAGGADMSVRGLIGDDSRFDDGSSDVSADKLQYVSISRYEDDDQEAGYPGNAYAVRTKIATSPWINSDAPALIAFGQTGGYSASNFLATPNDGTTSTSGTNAGHIYFLKYHYQQAGIDGRFEEHFGQGAVSGHDDINDYLGDTGDEFMDFMNAVLQLQLVGSALGVASVEAEIEVLREHDLAATITGVATVSAAFLEGEYIILESLYGGGVYGEPYLSAFASGTSTVSAEIVTSLKKLDGESLGLATVSADLKIISHHDISGEALGSALPVGIFTIQSTHVLDDTVLGVASVEAELVADRTHDVSGEALGVASVEAQLVANQEHDVAGESLGIASVEAEIVATQEHDLAGSALGIASVEAEIVATQEHDLSGLITGVASVEAEIVKSGVWELDGSAHGLASVEADLTASSLHDLAGTALGLATVSADLEARQDHDIAGTILGVADVSAVIVSEAAGIQVITGTSQGTATVSASIISVVHLDGSALGSATSSASLIVEKILDGSSLGSASVEAELESSSHIPLDGESTGSATVEAVLISVRHLAGSAHGVASVTGSINKDGTFKLDGEALGSGSVSAAISLTKHLNGSAFGDSSSSAELKRAAVLGRTPILGTSVVSADVLVVRVLTGTAAGIATVSARISFLNTECWIVGPTDTLQRVTPIAYVYDDSGTLRVGDASDLRYLYTVGHDGP